MEDDTPEIINDIRHTGQLAGLAVYRQVGNGHYHIEDGNYILASVGVDETGQGSITVYAGTSYQDHPHIPQFLALYAIAIRRGVPFKLEGKQQNIVYQDDNRQ